MRTTDQSDCFASSRIDSEQGARGASPDRRRHRAQPRQDLHLRRDRTGLPLRIRRSSFPTARRRRRDTMMEYHQTSRPGSRAPHAWLAEDARRIDLFGRGFVLLRFGGAAPDPPRAVAAAARRAACRSRSSTSPIPRSPRSTSADWCWCAPTAMSPGAPTRRPQTRPRSSTGCAGRRVSSRAGPRLTRRTNGRWRRAGNI